jgi:hypothetical protein
MDMQDGNRIDLLFGTGFPDVARRDTALRTEFLDVLSKIIAENGHMAQDVATIAAGIINRVEYGLMKSKLYPEALQEIIVDPKGFLRRIESLVGRPVRRLMIVPCPDYVIQCAEALAPHLEELCLYDNLKAGRRAGGVEILPFDHSALPVDRIDACFSATNDARIASLFLAHLPPGKVASFAEVFAEQVKADGQDSIATITERINVTPNPVVVLSSVCSSTLFQTYKTIDRNRAVFFISRIFVPDHPGYGVMPTEKVDLENNYIVDYDDMLYLLRNIRHGNLIFVSESFFHPDWDARLTVPSYAYSTAVMRFSAVPVTVLLYDAIKPVARNFEYEELSAFYYEQMLQAAGSVILSSNTKEMGDFLRHSCAPEKEFISFFRYSCAPTRDIPKLNDGFHLVAISVYLGEFKEPSRDKMTEHIVSILRQGIHFHYYSSQPGAHRFRESLDEETRRYLHIHPIILDQEELVEEMTQYHCGWITSDLSVFGDIIAKSSTQLYKDIFDIFPASTIPSSAMVYACAGLPVLTNRGLWGIRNIFPENCAVPLEMAETKRLADIIAEQDWPEIWKRSKENRARYTLDSNIGELIGFLNKFSKSC